ncbi:phage terminase GpA [Magnetococcus marinus MC-1]|uniref:Phage terminase GpA n=1 Tax=Magnetococcus marinus (strain ATCC BAA-1437 / JCM 17883 / MC-1) TaxID=156889 RepID=A0LBH0_MAGMM|nr:phage terminase large subunit family protein [Magnetococcus marinus]ABK45313.1 phage terminase GpA [Magnetococcus marinus MC-1]
MAISAARIYEDAFLQGLMPDPHLTVSEWADEHRMLSSVASGEPGPWRTDRTPYLQEVMDSLSPSSPIERVVAMFGSQLGKTECGLNWVGYVIHHAPGPMLMVQPTVEMAKRYSKQRVGPLIESSSEIRERVKPARSRDSGNTVLSKEFPGGILLMTGANSAVGLSSAPIRYLFMDEVDRFPGDADGEGDPVALAIQRTANFSNRKVLLTSTPTIKGFSRIEAAYAESDQRQFWVPCPECGEFQVLTWAQVKWPHGERKLAYYLCPHCESQLADHQKGWMLENGVWRAAAAGDGKTAGFHLSSLYSPHGWTSWGDIAVEHGLVHKDPSRLKTWVNTKMGQCWEEQGDRIDDEGLMERREAWGALLPADVAVLTAGVDVQDDRLEIEIVGWGRDEESWSIDYRVLWGDPSSPAVWEDLDNLLRYPRPHSRQLPDMTIRAAAIDTGGHHTLKSYAFCRSRQGRRIWAIKGRGGQGVPIWPRKPSTKNKGKVPLFIVGVDACKEAILSRLRIEEPGPGYLHFPMQRDGDYFKQLTAESVVTRYHKGRPIREWKKRDSDRNEALDCRVYAMAALQGLIAMGFRLNMAVEKIAEHPLKDAMPEPGKVQQKKIKPKRRVIQSSWV